MTPAKSGLKWRISRPLPDEVLTQRLRLAPFLSHSIKTDVNRGSFLSLDLALLLVQLLHNRGIENPADFEPFLTIDERLAHDPLLLPDIDRAVTRILRALLGDEIIAIYGDFDADGVTGTVLLMEGISLLGGRVLPYIPHRIDEGHGLNCSALNTLKEQGVSLVVTVDCGINGALEVEHGRKLGLDIIITDHHEPSAISPHALAAIDPKLSGSAYPFRELAGVGVAYKLLQALFAATGRTGQCDDFLDLVVLGTITDMVSLTGENRYLAKRGLEVLNRSQRVGIQELARCAGLEMGKLNEESISYMLGPRLNASGRMDHALLSYELLIASSREQASELAARLEVDNCQRQKLTAEFVAKSKEKLLLEGIDQPLLMVGGSDYPSGVAGVVAGKLTDEFYRPAIVLRLDEETAKGSARSIPEFDIVAALTKCQDLLIRFGGHQRAAGFVVSRDNIDQLRQCLLEIAGQELAGVDLRPAITVDAEIPLSSLTGETYKAVNKFAPFGQGNPAPALLSRKVQLLDSRKIGNNGGHLKLKLRNGKVVWDAIAFDLGDRELASHLDIVYNLQAESWNGRETLRLNIIDFLPSL